MIAQYLSTIHQINSYALSAYIGRLVSEDIAREYEIVPLQLRDNRLLIASAYGLSRKDIVTLQRLIRYPVDVVKASIMDVRRARAILYREESDRPKRIPIEFGLLKTGMLNEDQLANAREQVSAAGSDLASIALQKGLITDSQWSEVHAFCDQLPHIRLQTASPLAGLDFLIPYEQSQSKAILPLWWVGDALYLGVSGKRVDEADCGLSIEGAQCRKVVCSPNLYRQLQKLIYKPAVETRTALDENIVAALLVRGNFLEKDELDYALEMQRNTNLSLRSILSDQYGITTRLWLDAAAEILDTLAVYEKDLPDDIEIRVAQLLPLFPSNLVARFDILPLNKEENTLIIGMPEDNPALLSLIAALTGCEVELRLMERTLIHSLLDQSRDIMPAAEKTSGTIANQVELTDFLLSIGILQQEQLEDVLAKAQDDNVDSMQALLEANLINEIDLAEILSLVSGIPYLTLEYYQPDASLVNLIPDEIALESKIFPLMEYEGDLWVAVDNLSVCEFLGEIQTITGRRVWPVLVPETPLRSLLNRFYQLKQQKADTAVIFELADQLVSRGLITQAESTRIATDIVKNHMPFDAAVLNGRDISADELSAALAEYLNVEHVNLTLQEKLEEQINSLGELVVRRSWGDPVDANIARLIDIQTAKRLMAIPIGSNEDGVKVAFADPLFKDGVEELELLTGRDVIPCLAGRVDINRAIERVLGRMNLGTSLLMAGRITLGQLNNALALAQNSNIRLGRALVHRGYIDEKSLYQFLAHQAHLPLFDLSKVELDMEAAKLLQAEDERRLGILPLAVDDEQVYLAMVDPLNDEGIQLTETITQKKVKPFLVTERNLDMALERLYQDDYLAQSISDLLSRTPDDSAFRVFSRGQIIFIVLAFVLSAIWIVLDWLNFLIVVNTIISIIYLVFSGYKAAMITNALRTDLEVDIEEEDIESMTDRDLPVYTLLVPVFREANVLPEILKALTKLDYPAPKLDIKILLEANDQETIDAFFAADPPDFIRAVIVPDAQPKTKPKACNYGLIHARGEFLVIYDAEDLPEADQLKRSVAAFRKVPPDVVCIQAKLNYYNRTQNVLTQWFTSEYSMWFDLLLPGLDAARAPIPLGGTSNHFRTFSLVEVGAWDPYNVTEDADLGIRLYKRGYRTRIMDSTTYEEANSDVGNWIRQRSRWIKGYIQTWLVHMRHPIRLLRDLGPRAFMSFQIMIGGTFFTLLVNPIYWLMTSAWYFYKWDLIQVIYPGTVFFIGAICLYVGNFVFTYANIAGAIRRKYYDMVRVTLFSPAYWGLMSIGAWKGFIQMLTRPHFWEKTIHGLSKARKEAQDS